MKEKGLSRQEVFTGVGICLLVGASIFGIRQICDSIPTPSLETPTPSAATGISIPETEKLAEFIGKHFRNGECARVGPDEIVVGHGPINDISINGTPMVANEVTNDPNTELNDPNAEWIINFQAPAEVRVSAPDGGNTREVINPNEKPKLIEDAVWEKIKTGGINHKGVKKVFVITYRGNEQVETAVYKINPRYKLQTGIHELDSR